MRTTEPSSPMEPDRIASTVDVWLVDPADVPADGMEARYRALLSNHERERLDRYRIERVRRQYLLSRVLARTVLGELLALAPERIVFTTTPEGRPELATKGAAPLRCNLSHTDGLIALAVVAEHAVGLDVERHDRAVDALALAERFFAPSECDALRAGDDVARRGAFFVHWTLKEAYLKARGTGLSGRLDSAVFALDGGSVRASLATPPGEGAQAWTFVSFQPTSVHCAALAVGAPAPLALALDVRRTVPLLGTERVACTVVATGG